MKTLAGRWLVVALAALWTQAVLAADNAAPGGPALERLRYNNPGLAVDLGVGLWAFPLPMDFNGDGRLDMVVDCPDKPYNGVYVFENPGVDTGQNPLPVFKPGRRISAGLQMAQLSMVDGKPRVLGPGVEYAEFLKSGLDGGVKLPLPGNVHSHKVRGNFWRYVDYDGDGATDILSGNTAGYLVFFKNLSGPGVERPKWAAPQYLEADGRVFRIMAGPNGSIQGPAEAKWGYTTLSVADWDGDGLPDLIVNSIWGKVVWLKNIGTRQSPKLAAAVPIEVQWDGPQPALSYGWLRPEGKALLTQWRTTPVAVD